MGLQRTAGDERGLLPQCAVVPDRNRHADVAPREARPADAHQAHARGVAGRAPVRAQPRQPCRPHRPRGGHDVSRVCSHDLAAGVRAAGVSRRRRHVQPPDGVFRHRLYRRRTRRGVAWKIQADGCDCADDAGHLRSADSGVLHVAHDLAERSSAPLHRRVTDDGVFDSHLACTAHRPQRDSRPRDEHLHGGVPRRHAARQPCRRLLRDDHRGAEGHRHPRLPPVPRRPLFPTGSQPRNTRVRLTDSPLLFSNSSIVTTHPHQPDLRAIATRAMIARGFIVQFPSDAQQQTRSEAEPRFDSYKAKDLSSWLWSSIRSQPRNTRVRLTNSPLLFSNSSIVTTHPHQPDLRAIATRAMIARGFIVQFPSDAQQQTRSEAEPRFDSYKAKDLSSWLWSSIDNDDSKDLDQIEYALREATGTRIYIGIADVDWFVPYDSPLDHTAWQNTTSIYTGVVTFPMLPERLSTDLSSLNENENRLAVVMEVLVSDDGRIVESAVYPAIVRNQSQLTYDGVAAWLEEKPGNHLSEASQRTLRKIANSAEFQSQLGLEAATAALLR